MTEGAPLQSRISLLLRLIASLDVKNVTFQLMVIAAFQSRGVLGHSDYAFGPDFILAISDDAASVFGELTAVTFVNPGAQKDVSFHHDWFYKGHTTTNPDR